jgi:hypothetical protein
MERLRHLGELGLGIILAVTPLALWIAWTPAMVIGIMLAAVASAALLALLVESSPENVPSTASMRKVPEEFIEEVHRLFPLTYHHSLRESPRFRKAMSRLSEMVEEARLDRSPR